MLAPEKVIPPEGVILMELNFCFSVTVIGISVLALFPFLSSASTIIFFLLKRPESSLLHNYPFTLIPQFCYHQ